MKCKYCGAVLETGSKFCYRCGKATEQESTKRYCGYCGAELETGAVFCWQCGKAASPAVPSEDAEKVSEASAAQNTDNAAQTEAEEKAKLKARTAALVLAAQSGDSDSFTELYQLYYQKIFALAKATVRSNDDAEDVLQMTFLKAWNHLGKLKNLSAFSTWIQRITLNQCYSLLRKKHIDISIDNGDEDTEPIQLESDLMLPEVYAERSDLKERLGRIIRSLSTLQQQAVSLYYFDGLPVENIAWIMDCSVNTVKSRLFLARKSIKTEIEEQERKSGQPFYGIVGLGTIPFGKLFVEQVEANALPQSAVSEVLESITQYIAESVAKNVGQAAAETARSAGEASAKTVANSAAKTTAGVTVKASARTAAKAATAAVSKKIIAGIVAGVLAVGAVAGGAVAAVSAVKKNRAEAAQTQIVQEKTLPAEHWQEPDIFDPEQADLIRAERQAAYRAYLDCLIENKSGIDNYIWQKGYTLLYDEDDRELLPLTDDLLARPVAICDVHGDDTPELIFIGDVAPGEWNVSEWGEAWYQNDSVARLRIVTYRDGKTVTLYDDDWDGWGDSWNGYHFFQIDGSKDLYATWSNGDVTSWDYVYSFTEGTDGKLHKEQVCLFLEDFLDDEDDGKLYYGGHNQRISEDEYHSMLRSFNENTTNILMYSHIGIEEFRSSVEQHGCSAMTCDEAIAYLEKQLDLDRVAALDDCLAASPYLYNNDLAVSCAALCLSTYSGPLDSGIKLALNNYGFQEKNIISNNYSGPTMNQLGSLAYTIAIKDYRGADAIENEKMIVIVLQGTTNVYEMLRDVVSNTDTKLRGYDVYSIVREFKQSICEELEKCGWLTGKYKILITGHSLGGAAANYLAATLIDELPGLLEKEDIYCYTFAAINSIASDHPVEEGFENIHNIYNMYDTFSPEHFGSSLISGMGGGYGKFGHMDIYSKDHRTNSEANMAAPIQIAAHINHDMDKYMKDVKNGLVQCSSAYKGPQSKAAMYRTYIDVLQRHEDHILRYQKDAWFDADTRPIALRNVYSDEMPELLFLESISGDYDDEVALVIVTYSDGSAQTIFSDTVCYDIIEESFFLYQLPGNDTLYMSTSSGRQYVSMDTYYAFVPGANGNLQMKEKMYLEAEADPDSGSKSVYFCEIDGKNAKESEFAKEEAYISNYLDCVLQGNLIPRYGYLPESIPSMTYEEATLHLKQLIANVILE